MRIVVLGGAGGVGRMAVSAVATQADVSELIVADTDLIAAQEVLDGLPHTGAWAVRLDAADHDAVVEVIRGADCVLNCVGPFYRYGPALLAAAIAAGVRYVDVCDDLAPTRTMLEMSPAAQRAGVPALIGMGNSPGLANLFVAVCDRLLMDELAGVDVMHIHGGEPSEGPAVVKHRIFAMLNDVPLFVDGQFVTVRQLEASGEAATVETDFRGLGVFPVYPYPHPETITLPRSFPNLRRATNLGVVFPLSYFHLTQDMVRVGACGEEPLQVGDQAVVPIDFSVAHILARRPHLLAEAGIEGPAGCLKVQVDGRKDGHPLRAVFSLSSASAGAGEGTGIPAAAGAVLMARGRFPTPGVAPPESVPDPLEVLMLVAAMASELGSGGKDSIHVELTDHTGVRTEVPLPL